MAKIVITADLHLGITPSKTIVKMIDEMAAVQPDAVIVAGDLGEPFHVFERCLSLLQALSCPVGILAGNHDIWVRPSDDYDSAELFFDRLPKAVRSRGMVWLETDDIRLSDGVAIAGTIGWYDYSHRYPATLGWTEAQFAAAKPTLNNDGNSVVWPFTDPEFAGLVGRDVERRLTTLEVDSTVGQIVVATHVPAFAEQLVHRESDNPVADAYFANLTLGTTLIKHSKVAAVISGHTHRGVLARGRPRIGSTPLRVATVGSEYFAPKFQILDI